MCSRHAEAGAGAMYAQLAYVESAGEEILGLLVWEAPAYIITDMTWAETSSRALDLCRWNLSLAKGDESDMRKLAYENARRWLRISDYAITRLMRRMDS